jgi:hypothetical protein
MLVRQRTRLLALLAGLLVLVGLAVIPALSGVASAGLPPGSASVRGQGEAAFPKDLDPAADVNGCTYVVRANTSSSPSPSPSPSADVGRFDCTMSQDAIDLGVAFSELHASAVDLLSVTEARAAIAGTGTVTEPDGTILQDVPVTVRVREGPVDVGTLAITLSGVFDGASGDTKPGNGDYDLAAQVVTSGRIGVESGGASPSPSESVSPGPTPSSTPTPTPTSPGPSISPPPSSGGSGGSGWTGYGSNPLPIVGVPGAQPVTGPGASSAKVMAILGQLSPDGEPPLPDILQVMGPFPVAGLAWWQDDWHAYRCCPYPHLHQGLDMFAARGTPVVAAADGHVTQRVVTAISGRGVEIQDAAGTQYFYAHLSGFAPGLAVGQAVHVGQVLGYVGNSGDARDTSTHLHFEIQPHGIPEPPMPHVDQWLALAEQKATALVEARMGFAPSLDSLPLWAARAEALGANDAGEQADQSLVAGLPPSQQAAALAPSAGMLVAFTVGLLILFLIGPGVPGRRPAVNGVGRRVLPNVNGPPSLNGSATDVEHRARRSASML